MIAYLAALVCALLVAALVTAGLPRRWARLMCTFAVAVGIACTVAVGAGDIVLVIWMFAVGTVAGRMHADEQHKERHQHLLVPVRVQRRPIGPVNQRKS